MANYATLKAAIQQVVKTNGNNEITGALLQQSLLSMINSLGAEYQFAGVATSDTNPGTPDQNVFYIAGSGTYPNFNAFIVPDGYVGIMKYNGSWTNETLQVGKNYDADIAELYDSVQEKADMEVLSTTDELTTSSATVYQYLISGDAGVSGVWVAVTTNIGCRIFNIRQGQHIRVTAQQSRWAQIAFLNSVNIVAGNTPDFTDTNVGVVHIPAGMVKTIVAPNDCYLYVQYRPQGQNSNYYPAKIEEITPYTKIKDYDDTVDYVNEKKTYLQRSKNLFNPFLAVDGQRIRNSSPYTPQSSEWWWRSDYIDVSGISQIFFNEYVPANVAFYDANKTYVGGYGSAYNKALYDVPAGSVYMLAAWAKDGSGTSHAYRVTEFSQRFRVAIYEWRGFNEDETFEVINGKMLRYVPNWRISMADILPFASNVTRREFTNSTFRLIVPRGQFSGVCNMIFSAFAKFTNNVDESVPTIQFQIGYNSNLSGGLFVQSSFTSIVYTIGSKDNFERKSWRVPRMDIGTECILVRIVVPENVTLTIYDFGNSYESNIFRPVNGLRLDAHGGYGFGRLNTIRAVEAAAAVGAKTVIAVPKRTSDGVWVCFHDDGDVNGALCYEDGSAIASGLKISDLTAQQLSGMRYKDTTYRATYSGYMHVPTMVNFLSVCAKMGVSPMFSVHPFPTVSEWQELKDIVKKSGLLSTLEVKFPVAGISGGNIMDAYSVLGTDIAAYGADVSLDGSFYNAFAALAIDGTKVRRFIEYFSPYVTEERVAGALSVGLDVSIYDSTGNYTGEDYKYWSELGVTEFTTDGIASFGLNW